MLAHVFPHDVPSKGSGSQEKKKKSGTTTPAKNNPTGKLHCITFPSASRRLLLIQEGFRRVIIPVSMQFNRAASTWNLVNREPRGS